MPERLHETYRCQETIRGPAAHAVAPPSRRAPLAHGPPRRPWRDAVLSDCAWQAVARSLRLSGRELQLARAVFEDRTESAMAADLGITRRTVHTHFERLHRKLAVRDRVQLVLPLLDELLFLTVSPEHSLPPICANRASGRCPLAIRTSDAQQIALEERGWVVPANRRGWTR